MACGLTHTMVTPLDVVKCNLQTDPKNYTGIAQGFRKIATEQGFRGLFKGFMPTAIGYSAQGAFKVRQSGASSTCAGDRARGSGLLTMGRACKLLPAILVIGAAVLHGHAASHQHIARPGICRFCVDGHGHSHMSWLRLDSRLNSCPCLAAPLQFGLYEYFKK